MDKYIDNYQILSKIASGGMANVYLALDTTTNSKVAIKVLKEEVSDKEKILERFSQEGLLNLNHPNIVKILDAGIHENTPYIVMEYIDGWDLETLIKNKGKLSVNETLYIFGQLLSALAYVHNKGITHRDIKPKNILIDKSGNVKLTDFGIAKSLYSHIKTSTGGYIGAPAYSSPEQMDGKEVDARSDIYSMGITLYEMLAGHIPYSSSSIDVIVKEKFSESLIPLSRYRTDIPLFLVSIITKCMSKNPINRFSSTSQIFDILNKNKPGETIVKNLSHITKPKNKFAIAFGIVVPILIIIIFIFIAKLNVKTTTTETISVAATTDTAKTTAATTDEEAAKTTTITGRRGVALISQSITFVPQLINEQDDYLIIKNGIQISFAINIENQGNITEANIPVKATYIVEGVSKPEVKDILIGALSPSEQKSASFTGFKAYPWKKCAITIEAGPVETEVYLANNTAVFKIMMEGEDKVVETTAVETITSEPIVQKATYNIGDVGPAGGYVFYINPNYKTDGWRYLEAAASDLESDNNDYYIPWYNRNYVETGATATAIGTGMSNTQKIVDIQGNGSYAAKLCVDLIQGGYNGWFLPSKDELNLMYENIHLKGIGSFESDYYWSSSETGINIAWFQGFGDGYQGDNGVKGSIRVRAIRAFN